EAVNHAAFQGFADRHAQGSAQRDDFTAGMDAVNFTERHEQNMIISEANDFGQGGPIMPGGFDAADFAHGSQRTFGLDDEADELDDASLIANDAGFLNPAKHAFEAVGDKWFGAVGHESRFLFKRSNLVSRRASTMPKRVCTRHPPRVTSGEPRKRKSFAPSP